MITFTSLTIVQAQVLRSPTIKKLQTKINEGNSNAEKAFWQNFTSGPLIEQIDKNSDTLLVTFLYHGSGNEKEVILHTHALWPLLPEASDGHLKKISSESNTWYFTMPVPSDLQTTYTFHIMEFNGKRSSIVDPANPDSIWSSSGSRVSALSLSQALAEPWRSEVGSTKASWIADTLQWKSNSKNQEIWIHLPPQYDPNRPDKYPLVIALNKYNFRYAISTGSIVDYLIKNKLIPPAVLVVADELEPGKGNKAYESSAEWIADGLLPWLRNHYNISSQSADIILAGASRRGLVAAAVALDRPDAVGNVLSMSGAFYWRPKESGRFEWLAARYAAHKIIPVRFYLSVGKLETVISEENKGHYPLATTRHFADVLQARGYKYRLDEFSGTHDELNWQGWFAVGLKYLLGSSK